MRRQRQWNAKKRVRKLKQEPSGKTLTNKKVKKEPQEIEM